MNRPIISIGTLVLLLISLGCGGDKESKRTDRNGIAANPRPNSYPDAQRQSVQPGTGVMPLPTASTCFQATPEVCAIEAEVWRQTNLWRQEGGFLRGAKPEFSFGLRLTYAARRWSEKVARGEERFGHKGFTNRESELQGVFTNLSSLDMSAENIIKLPNSRDPRDLAAQAIRKWSFSPGHRWNMLSGHSSMGVGAAIGRDGMVYITQIMGDDSLTAVPLN